MGEPDENCSSAVKEMEECEDVGSNAKQSESLDESKQEAGVNDCRGPDKEVKEEVENEFDANEPPETKVNAHVMQQAVQQLYNDPSFAVICSFFNKFAVFLGLKPQCFAKIERMFTSFHETGKVDRDLIDLHLTLLRKLTFKSARMEVWEKYLLKFCSFVPSLESEYLQLERYGYLHTTAATKLAVFKALCESQFDYNLKFKESLLNSCTASDLRLLPVGYDKEGLAYWYQQDADLVIRVYSAEQDDHSGGSWNLVAKSKEELEKLVAELKNRLSSKYVSNLLKHREDSAPGSVANEMDEKSKISSKFSTKRGSLLDAYQDESAIKKKDVKPNRTKKKAVEEESKKENSAPPVEITEDIPDEVKPFLDRRVLPRRSARNAAINHLKELTAPQKSQSGRQKNKPNKKKAQDEQVENAKQPQIRDKNDNDKESGEDDENDVEDDEDEDENAKDDDTDDFVLGENSSTSSDDEFMPLSELKKRSQSSKRRRGKRVRAEKDPFDVVESEEDEDSDDDQEKKAKKERKRATEETLCMKCNKSSNPEVLLLCDLCDEAWHTWCLHPMLWYVPDDDWFCPNCHQAMLIEKFSEVLITIAEQLKRKAAEDKKKEAAAERLKREMEYIGVSLNNIIDTVKEVKEESSETSEESEEDDGERKSKKKAIRRLGFRPQKPIVPIALSRSRRHVAKVDYNFGAYDELIQEAVKNIDEAAARQMSPANSRPKGGAGRGKDMSNIINAEKKRVSSSIDDSCEDDGAERQHSKVGKPARSRHRLNDLNVDEMTESDTDEYQASENASVSDPSDDTDEYVPSDSSHTRRASKRNYYSNKRTQSDDDFVVSGSESEYEPSSKKSRRSKNVKKAKGKRKRGRWVSSDEDSTSEQSDDYQSEESGSSDDRRAKRRTATKWAPRASSSDAGDSDHSVQKTATGRPLRKAVAKKPSLTVDDDDDDEDEEEEKEVKKKPKDVRPIGTGRKIESSDEFEPDEDEEEDDDDEEAGEEEEEDEEETSKDDEKNGKQSDQKRSKKGERSKTVEEEKDTEAVEESKFDAAENTPAGGTEEKAVDVNDVPPSTSDEVADKAGKVKMEPVGQEALNDEGTKAEPAKTIDVKAEEKTEISNSAAPSSIVAASVPPTCFPSTSTDSSSAMNPSTVMEQMARLASSSSAPVRQQFHPTSNSTTYQATLHTTAPAFMGSGAPPHMYSGPIPVTFYQVRQPAFVRTPGGMIPSSGVGPVPQGWPPYPPPNCFPANVPPPSVVVATTAASSPPPDSETLGNALASAMDY